MSGFIGIKISKTNDAKSSKYNDFRYVNHLQNSVQVFYTAL